MSEKPRRLRSVPTGPDVTGPAALGPAGSASVTPLRSIDPGPAPTDTQALMDRIDRSGDADRSRGGRRHLESAGPRVSTAAPFGGPGHRGLPPVPADLWARSSGPLGSAVQDMLSRIDFAAPVALPAATAGQLASRYSWLLSRVGSDGLDLTSAGYLKPLDVSAAFTELDLGSEWIGTGNREIHVRPLLMLRQSAQRLGLLRNSKGRLTLTKAGASIRDDPAALVDWIASRLPLARRDEERDAGLALLTVVAADADGAGADRSIDALVADLMSGLGWQGVDGERVSPPMARAAAEWTSLVLRQLGAVVWLPRRLERTITPQGAEFATLALTLGSPGRG